MTTATTAVGADAPASDAPLRGRTLNVIRLQFINRQTFIWIPLLVFGGTLVITLVFVLIAHTAGSTGPIIVGASQGPLWYFAVVGAQAMNLTFPFSQAMSLTRREFYLGSLAAASVSALGVAVLFVLVGLVERATDGFGMNGYYAYLGWLWERGPLAAGLTFFAATMLFFTIGFCGATVYRRYGTAMLIAVILMIALALVGLAGLVTVNSAWPEVWRWILDTGALGLALWGIVPVALLAVASYLVLRRMPV